ncbi:myb-like protein X isoform X2 [Pieris rapae]|uniref:myb-like protein X isoform X2 n=1 Tax=Pieris rapae TaxID=64459 RepID=UPI001E27F89C|nr:myb-like protein X isoform X2 [Pieris rapae]
MLSKYSIYGGGRWREIDLETGRVAGWAGSKFVYTKRGKLIVPKPKSVLRGLMDLASGHISTVKDGFQLSQLKKKKKPKKSPKQIKCKCDYKHNHVFAAPNDQILQANIANASIQCNIVPVNKTLNKLNIKECMDKDVKSVASVESIISDNIARAITISESDVETFRSYIVHSTKNIFNVDLFMYDANDDYKRSVFYKITPIVKVQRHPIIHSLVRQKQFKIKLTTAEMRNKTKTLTKNNYCEPKIKVINHVDNSDSDVFKEREIVKPNKSVIEHQRLENVNKDLIVENKGKRKAAEVINQAKRSKLNNSDSLKENNDNVPTDKFGKPINKVFLVKKWTVKNKSSRKRPTNEFSLLEDEAIVDWIVKNKKGNLVNGNRMWKEMEPQHLNVTGQYRSWHSLRNRYLRHLLPALGSLSLTPSQVIDLRAAAATGELKANKMNKNNSIYRTEPVRSAWNARPQKLKHSDDEPFTPPRNSNLVSSRSKLPTYSEITRRFAEKHRSTPNSEENVTNNKVKPRDGDQTNKQPRVSLKIIRVDTNSNEQGSLRVVNIDDKQDKKTEEKSVSKSREKSSRFVSSRDESYGVEKKNRRGRKGNETDTDEEIKNNVNKKFENDLGSADRSGLNNKHKNRRNKDDSDSEQRNENQGREIRSSRRLRHEKSGVEDTLGQNKSKMESNPEQKNQRQGPKTLENRASSIKSPEKSLTERSIGRRKNGRFIAIKRYKEISSVDKKNPRQLRNNNDSDSEPETKKRDDNGRSSARNRDKEISRVDKKNPRQLRSNNDSDSEPENKKRDDNGRSSARNRDKEISRVDKKNSRQLRSNNDSDSEPENKKRDDNGRSSARNRDKEISRVDKKNPRQLRSNNDSDSEPENKKRDDNGRSSARNREKEISSEDRKNPRQLRNKNDSDSEPETNKRDDNGRSSAKNMDKEISSVDKNPRQLRNKNNSDSKPESRKRDDSGRFIPRNRDKEISSVDRKNPRQLRNKSDSDSEPENKKRDDNGQTSRNRDKSGKSDNTLSRSKKRDNSDTDNKENGADNKMYLRQYKYTSGAKMETTKKRENGNISKNRKNNKPVKVDRSKRKYVEILDSESENEREKKNKRDRRSSCSDSDFVKISKKATKRSRSVEQSDNSDFSVNTSHLSMTSRSDFDSSNDKDKKRLTRQSHRVESGRDIVFEISDNDEAYASRSDTEVKNTGKRNLRKLFNHRAL